MPKFDRVDGEFVSTFCTFEDRLVFKRAGWRRRRVAGKHQWYTIEEEYARLIFEHADGAAKEYLDNVNALRAAAVADSWAEDTDAEFPAPDGLAYMPFQKAGIEYALSRERTLIADSPGLGKTIQAIGVHNARRANRVLIVCPASLKVNWTREWERWDVHGLSVDQARSEVRREPVLDEAGERMRDHNRTPMTRTWTEHVWPDTDVVIVNYDMLPAFDAQIKAQTWSLVVYDEAHLLKTADALRTMAVFGGKKKQVKRDGKVVSPKRTFTAVEAERHLYLTGTPILSRPIELWTLLRACDRRGLGRDRDEYAERYCEGHYGLSGWDESGASNLEELSTLLRERFMVRRDKRSVLKELPDKTRELVVFPKDKLERPVRKEKTRVETALEAFESELGIEADPFRYIDDLANKLSAAMEAQNREEPDWDAAIKTLSEPDQIVFAEISSAREEVALAKVGLATEHILKLVESEEPVIAFAYHKSVVKEMQKRLEKSGLIVGIVTGDVPPNKRQAIIDAFQAGELDVIIGNIIAMGVGYTLTRARFVVFAELDWVPSMIEQAEDRAWRHGQINAVVVQHLVVDGSIEARMAIAMLEKMGVIMQALDGEANVAT